MLGQRDLVEHRALGARDGTLVVGTATLLQPLKRLALPSGFAQRVAARADLGVVAVKVQLTRLAHLLHPLEVGLMCRQVRGVRSPTGSRRALRGERTGDLLAHRAQALGAVRLAMHRAGKLLLGEIFAALTQRPQALQRKTERRHAPGSRRVPRELEEVDGRSSTERRAGSVVIRYSFS